MDKTEKIKQKVLSKLDDNREETIELLRDLIKIPSVNGEEGKVQKFIAQKMRDMGLEVDMWEPSLEELKKHPGFSNGKWVRKGRDYKNRPNVVGVYSGNDQGKSLILNGHADVVPIGPMYMWNVDPLGAEVKNGKIYGRGSADMKFGIAGMIMALKAILHAGVELDGRVILESVVDEEAGSNGTLACVLRGYKADAAINLEGTHNVIAPSQAGGLVWGIKVFGQTTSVLRRLGGINVTDNVWKIYKALSQLEKARIQEVDHPLINRETMQIYVGKTTIGILENMMPVEGVIEGTMRYMPQEKTEDVQQQLVNFVGKLADLDPDLQTKRPEVTFYQAWHSAEIPVDHPIVTTLQKSYQEALNREAIVGGREGGTDGWILDEYGNTPTVAFGPGNSENMHVANEWVDIQLYLDFVKTLSMTYINWCGIR